MITASQARAIIEAEKENRRTNQIRKVVGEISKAQNDLKDNVYIWEKLYQETIDHFTALEYFVENREDGDPRGSTEYGFISW